jgi:hypothetical protein
MLLEAVSSRTTPLAPRQEPVTPRLPDASTIH